MDNYLENIGERARACQYALAGISAETKNKALCAAAEALIANADEIIKANERDVAVSREKGVSEALIDRLILDTDRIKSMADGLIKISELNDPIGELLEEFTRPNGLLIKKVRVPMGVIGIIYESRPNVTSDAFGLCFKSSNVSVLRGGSDAINSNIAIVNVLRDALKSAGVPKDSVILIDRTDRETATRFMQLNKYIDVLIPRGGAGLIRSVIENASIPVIETGTGNCHVYVDADADIDMAVKIIVNAKTQRMGVCNALESLVIHSEIAERAIPAIYDALNAGSVEIRAEDRALTICPDLSMKAAEETDYATEYLGPVISLKVVDSTAEAIAHINKYTTHHSESIVSNNQDSIDMFMNGIDAACVYVNASTRFTDGSEFGFGGEIGISTQKLHARGPMGLKELTSYKYKIYGNGQIR